MAAGAAQEGNEGERLGPSGVGGGGAALRHCGLQWVHSTQKSPRWCKSAPELSLGPGVCARAPSAETAPVGAAADLTPSLQPVTRSAPAPGHDTPDGRTRGPNE